MPDDPLRRALLNALGRRPTPARRRSLAAALRQLADEQEQLADAEQRQQTKPPAARVGGTGKGGRPSSAWVRVEERSRRVGEATEVRVLLSRSLYYAAGRPERLDVQRVGTELLLIPAAGDAGYAVVVNIGGVSINASGARDLLRDRAGRYAAEVRGRVVVVGGQLE